MSRTLKQIAADHPALIFDNDGYEYINRRKLSDADRDALDEVHKILSEKVEHFVKFFNFKPRKDGSIDARFDYVWDPGQTGFVGVGYEPIENIDAADKGAL